MHDVHHQAPTLFNWQQADDSKRDTPAIEVIGVPSDVGNSVSAGTRFGPDAIRRASLGFPSPLSKLSGRDSGDVKSVHAKDWMHVLKDIEQSVSDSARRRALPLILGGDHSISYAGVAAFADQGPLNIVWIDAHTDFCTWHEGPYHDHKQVLRRISGLPHVNKIVQIGHRGMTYADERQFSDQMTVITANKASELTPEAILEALPHDEPVYISVDIDAVDPMSAPGTGHPVPGGMSVKQVCAYTRAVLLHREAVAIDLMEVNPLLDHADMTARAAATILADMLKAYESGMSGRLK